jgi:hypothetical protein
LTNVTARAHTLPITPGREGLPQFKQYHDLLSGEKGTPGRSFVLEPYQVAWLRLT